MMFIYFLVPGHLMEYPLIDLLSTPIISDIIGNIHSLLLVLRGKRIDIITQSNTSNTFLTLENLVSPK